jgi:hypothetical protein
MNQAATPSPTKPTQRPLGRWVTVLVLFVVGFALMWRGLSFYSLGLAARAGHPDYRELNPSGFLGHGYGIAGTALILTNLLYLVRRRFARYVPDWAGSMKSWLNAHAFTGLVGSLLVLFHSAFQLRTAIASVTSVSLFIVVITGLVGFYLHALVPKAGRRHLKERLLEIEPILPGFATQVELEVHHVPVTALRHNASIGRTLLTVPRWIWQSRARRRAVRRAARADKLFRVLLHTEPKLAKSFVVELSDLASKEVDSQAAASIMRAWKSLHRFLAILMVVSVSVHIGVAWFYGFRWIFDQ